MWTRALSPVPGSGSGSAFKNQSAWAHAPTGPQPPQAGTQARGNVTREASMCMPLSVAMSLPVPRAVRGSYRASPGHIPVHPHRVPASPLALFGGAVTEQGEVRAEEFA
eukprot:2690878-Rhodomonas_salina.1